MTQAGNKSIGHLVQTTRLAMATTILVFLIGCSEEQDGLVVPASVEITIDGHSTNVGTALLRVTNPTAFTITIERIETTCGCTSLSRQFPVTILANAEVELPITMTLSPGETSKSATVTIFLSNSVSKDVLVSTHRTSHLVISPSNLSLGTITNDTPIKATFRVSLTLPGGEHDFELNCKTISNSPEIHIENVGSDRVELTVDPSAIRTGPYASTIRVYHSENVWAEAKITGFRIEE